MIKLPESTLRLIRVGGTALLSILVVITAISLAQYHYARVQQRPEIEDVLTKSADQIVDEVNTLVSDTMDKVVVMANHPTLQTALSERPDDPVPLLTKLEKVPFLRSDQTQTSPFVDLMLVDANQRRGIFSTTNKEVMPLNLQEGQSSRTGLGTCVDRALVTMSVQWSDFGFHPITKEPAIFVCAPILVSGQMWGTIVAQIYHESIYRILNKERGAGKSSEVILGERFANAVMIVNPTRHDPNSAFERSEPLNATRSTALVDSVMGGRGMGIYTDYRQIKTIAVWRYIPAADMGIVVKSDLTQILGPVEELRVRTMWFAVLTLALLLIALFISMRTGLFIGQNELLSSVGRFVNRDTLKWSIIVLSLTGFGVLLTSIGSYRDVRVTALQRAQDIAQLSTKNVSQQISHRMFLMSSLVNAIAKDLGNERLEKDDLPIRLEREATANPDLLGVSVAFEPGAAQLEAGFAAATQTGSEGGACYGNNTCDTGLTCVGGTCVYDLAAGDDIQGGTQATTERMYAPSYFRVNFTTEFHDIGTKYDRTELNQGGLADTHWYRYAIQRGASWSGPFIDPVTRQQTMVYSAPFYSPDAGEDDNPIGVVAAFCSLETIANLIASSTSHESGYSLLLSSDGYFLSHPLPEYVLQQRKLNDLQDQSSSKELAELATHLQAEEGGSYRYLDRDDVRSSWVYYQPITDAGWMLATVILDDSLALPEKLLWERRISVFLSLLSTLVLLTLWFTRIHRFAESNVIQACNLYAAIALVSIVAFWILIQNYAPREVRTGERVTDKTSVAQFVEDLDKQAATHHENSPERIPTGIYINVIAFPDDAHCAFSGYVWQEYTQEQLGKLEPGIAFPDASQSEILPAYKHKEGNSLVIGWNVRVVLAVENQYSRYPFDTRSISVPLEFHDVTKNVVLVPDISAYYSTAPGAALGLNENLDFSGFELEETFYSYVRIPNDTDLGTRASRHLSRSHELTYQVVLSRQILNSLILYFLPMVVVLISIFAVVGLTALIKTKSDPIDAFNPISAHTALFFVIVIIHRALRDRFQIDEILYLEYLFFFGYATILVSVIHAVLLFSGLNLRIEPRKFAKAFTVLFWPFQLSLWLVTTMLIFS